MPKASVMPPRRDPGKEVPDTVPVKMARDLHRKLKAIIAYRDKEVYQYLDELLRPAIEKDYREYLREVNRLDRS